MVVWNDWSMGRSTDVWGPDAIEFKPSRWIDEAGELVKVSQWKGHWYVPPSPFFPTVLIRERIGSTEDPVSA